MGFWLNPDVTNTLRPTEELESQISIFGTTIFNDVTFFKIYNIQAKTDKGKLAALVQPVGI